MANSPAREIIDVGSVIAGTYVIEALLGRGGMGAVFLASHKRLAGKQVAIKILHTDLTDGEIITRFRREAEIAAKLNHPNIVGVIDYNVAPDGTPYLVLDYLEGETLADRIARGPMALDHVLSIIRQIGSALAAAHRAGIVHRDLKPQNIFLVPTEVDGRAVEIAKVLDFGISKIRDSQTVKTQDSTLLGTPQYMAPEQATGQHTAIDERTDIFALGAIVYEMLSGQPAFSGPSIPAVVFQVVYEQPVPLTERVPSVPPSIVAAVGQAMAKPAAERFATVTAFVEALTGQPATLTRGATVPMTVPGGSPAANAPSTSRRVASREAFDQTIGSGDHGASPIAPVAMGATMAAPSSTSGPTSPQTPAARAPAGMSNTAAGQAGTVSVAGSASIAGEGRQAPSYVPAAAAPQAPHASTMAAAPTAPPSIAGSAASVTAAPTVDLHPGAPQPPSQASSRGPLWALVAIVGVAVIGGGTFLATRGSGPSQPTVSSAAPTQQPQPPAVPAPPSQTPTTAPAPPSQPATTAPPTQPPTQPAAHDGSADNTDSPSALKAGSNTAGTKPSTTKPATAHSETSPEPTEHPHTGRHPNNGSGHAAHPATTADDEGADETAQEKLGQANTALDHRDFDQAERLASAVINGPAGPKQRAVGHMIHGLVACQSHNDQETAQIDARYLGNFPGLRTRLVNTCHTAGINLSP